MSCKHIHNEADSFCIYAKETHFIFMQKIIRDLISLIFAGLLLLSSALSFQLEAQSASFSEMTSMDMRNQLHADEFTLIDVGNNRVPILISASEQPITKGIVLIIGDADMPLGRQDSLSQLAKSLPAVGWTTVVMPSLGLSLGSNIAFPIENEDTQESAKTDNSTQQNDDLSGATATPLADAVEDDKVVVDEPTNSLSVTSSISEADLVIYSLEIEAFISATLKHMETTMGHRILVSQGMTAATIAKLAADEHATMQQIDALVINNPYWPIRRLNNKIPMVVAQTPIPVLDLISYWDNSWSKQTEKARKIKARTELKEVYRQADIVGQTFDQVQKNYVARQIEGWTSYLGW